MSFGAALGGQLVIEQELDVADVDPVARGEPVVAARDELGVVDLGHVPGIEVGDEEVVPLAVDLGVPAADAVGVEHDVAVLGRPADHGPILLQLDDLPDGLAVGTFQESHDPCSETRTAHRPDQTTARTRPHSTDPTHSDNRTRLKKLIRRP